MDGLQAGFFLLRSNMLGIIEFIDDMSEVSVENEKSPFLVQETNYLAGKILTDRQHR